MKVLATDFSKEYAVIKDEIALSFEKVFATGSFILGEEVQSFEKEFSLYCGSLYGIGVNSGTDALYMALLALGIGKGDEVIIPSFTFIATALSVSYTGATPVFIDIEEKTFNMDTCKIEDAITERTKVIIPVHIYGQMANMDNIESIANKYDLCIVDDAAQAHGAMYKNKKVGRFGDMSCFSFYPTKGLGAFGDGGMIVTGSEEMFEKIQMLRNYGRKGGYKHGIKGFNSRLDTLQAAGLSVKLKYLDQWNDLRRMCAQRYREKLQYIDGIQLLSVNPDCHHVYQTFALRVQNRDFVLGFLREKGIEARVHYPIPVHRQDVYKDLGYQEGDFPVSERMCREVISLPIYPYITMTQVDYVCVCMEEALRGVAV